MFNLKTWPGSLFPNQGNSTLTNVGQTEEQLGLCPLLHAEIQCRGGSFSLPSTQGGVLAIRVFFPRVPWEPSSEAVFACACKSFPLEVLLPPQLYKRETKRIPSSPTNSV